ncbi:MAG TPA: methylated-DNA--[protein]-cysteine S-methyltransferase [Ktedonosporobacter sp.]|nr:methylated-DNA--[protein]-cysteine S-methyltransferase [Ktedonosporobacter sp.]
MVMLYLDTCVTVIFMLHSLPYIFIEQGALLVMVAVRQKTQLLYWSSVHSPRGECIVMATEDGVCWTGTPGTAVDEGLFRTKHWVQVERVVRGEKVPALQQAVDELQRYFAGEQIQFSCQLDLRGTPFQVLVWQELCRIPYGETRSYGEIARTIGRPSASRAVGAANGANPIAIIVPCHRVIGSNGSLTGYGGGLPTKEWLLSLERGLSIKHLDLA